MRTKLALMLSLLLAATTGCPGDDDPPVEVCTNFIDDDGDGQSDCADSDCAMAAACACGNGAIDTGEDCEGSDLGGATCLTEGYTAGTLSCNSACEFDTSECTNIPPEVCNNGLDDDGDTAVDCADTDCAAAPACGATGRPVGSACTATTECASNMMDAYCATEGGDGWPGGYCTEACNLTVPDCPDGATCLEFGGGQGYCVDVCGTVADCRPGYGCVDLVGDGTKACLFLSEICDNMMDEDADGDIDCADDDCADDAACAVCGDGTATADEVCDTADLRGETCDSQGYPGGTLACDGACALDFTGCNMPVCGDSLVSVGETCDDGNTMPLDGCDAACQIEPAFYCTTAATGVLGANTGDTTTGVSAFEGSCSGTGGAREHVIGFTPGVTGPLALILSSETDQGIYVRSDCMDAMTELGCADLYGGGTDEVLVIDATAGTPITIFVDGWNSPDQNGPYTLTIAVPVCGDGTITPPEVCDDGNTMVGDGCDAACAIEPAFYCMGATAGVIGANSGDTTGSTSLFTGTCTGGGKPEDIIGFTPAMSGTLTLTLSSATDQGIYARVDCADPMTELGCTDLEYGGTDETLSFAVTGGTPITIFVDGYHLDPAPQGPYTLTIALGP